MVLVTGGTGLVGSHLLYQLCRSGAETKALYRSESGLEKVKKVFSYYTDAPGALLERIIWVKGDILDLPSLETAFEGVKTVYHAAALISFDPKQHRNLEKTNVEGTANVVNLCIAHKVKKLCHVSTIGCIGRSPNGEEANEETPWNAQHHNVYALSKKMAEMEVWRGTQEGVPAVIVNPGVVLGPGFWTSGSGRFSTAAQKGGAFYPPGGTGFVSVSSVVGAMLALMASKAQNERFILVDGNKSYRELLTAIAQHLGVRPPTRELAPWQLHLGRFLETCASLFTGRERRLTKDTIKGLLQRQWYSTEKLEQTVTLKKTPLSDTLAFCCAQFKKENG
ncbi:NAD-dependent epimerase/dehydratase family protein [Maribacter sp. 2307ULW6-5]|uniref:NAD-dependent epimerase/dehydratase family protein n=1 Tax=Maribacter sp. 2307ULW6-5 TaxID=3386275 RepID=UPI0039BD52B8